MDLHKTTNALSYLWRLNMFIGRESEIKEIKDALNTNRFESIFLYGRRRVGKSEIIRQSTKDCTLPIVNFECKRASSKTNLENLTMVFLRFFPCHI